MRKLERRKLPLTLGKGALLVAGGWMVASQAAVESTPVAAVAAASAAMAPAAASTPAPTPPASKDVVLDVPATSSAPAAAAPALSTTSVAGDAVVASALAELGLDLLRQRSAASGQAQVNAVVSPLSLVSALGLIHAGTSGAGANELASLLGSRAAGERIYAKRLPGLLSRLAAADGSDAAPFTMANRVWVDRQAVAQIPASYASLIGSRFQSDGALLSFTEPEAARRAINGWVSQRTAQRIPELMPSGSVTPTTRLIATNAIHFKSPWDEPFDAAQTVPKPFKLAGGASKPVPTMVGRKSVRTGVVDNVTVIEMPFAGGQYALMIAMPPAGHTLNAFETDLDGVDIAGWGAQLKPSSCRVELPRFDLAPATVPLKSTLESLGIKTIFGPDADLTPMLGKAGRGASVDNVFQSATVTVDERGGEAAAATGASVAAKSIQLTPPAVCAVDRPFIFTITHKASGAPLFVGKIADPSLR